MDQLSSDLASLKIDRTPAREGGGAIKYLVWLALLGALGGAVAWVYPRVEAEVFKTQVKTGTVLDVSPSLAATSLTATGYVVALRRSKVGANLPGRIAKMHVREGSVVKAGDLLAELDADDQRGNVAAAQARVASAEAKVASSRASQAELFVQEKRQRALVDAKGVARSVLDDLEAKIETSKAEVAAAQAEVKAAQAQLALTKVNLGRMTIHAPIGGTVVDRPLEIGETIEILSPILELVDMTSLVVEIDVPEARLGLIKVGGPAEISLDAFPGQRLSGRVREIGKRVNRSKATVPVKVEFADPNAEALPDMSARVSFLTEALDKTQLAGPSKRVVPEKAVAKRGGREVVFVVQDGKVKQVSVTLGPKTDDGFELMEGPEPGSKVVLAPPETLASGQRVKEGSE
ncbi:MAG TPA: efflux RND transporter periplasmic adaptor subunit [Polyangiales bacterium]